MKDKNMIDNNAQETPLLEGEKETYEWPSNNRYQGKKWKWIYVCFMSLSILLCAGIVFLSAFGTGSRWIPSRAVARIAAMISGMEFRNLSVTVETNVGKEEDSPFWEVLEGILLPDHTSKEDKDEEGENEENNGSSPDQKHPLTLQALYSFDYNKVPSGETPIIPMDLSLSQYGNEYINNATGLKPDTKKLMNQSFKDSVSVASSRISKDPLILIVHTHGTEGYSEDGATSFSEQDGEELARSKDINENVVAVGTVLADVLNENGVSTLHCTIMHDQLQYKDAYARSEETIRKYLKEYPSIRLVIDLHRDSVLKSGGELVRPVTLGDGEAVAQMMCVVGSNWNGGDYPNWESNLALALKLRQAMNDEVENICRPVYLKGSTYNQELAPYSLLVEMGASGNSLEEAKRSAKYFANALISMISLL